MYVKSLNNNHTMQRLVFTSQNNQAATTVKKKKIATGAIAATSAITASAIGIYTFKSNSYLINLARDLSTELDKKITTKDLRSIMTKSELIKELSKLKEENFIASAENLKNGIFQADLHSHSNYSDGTINIQDFLNQAAEYGNKLNKINGKKFIIALTDHDGIEGTKEALKIIARNPDKYENIKFVPGVELSFVIPCAENSERAKRFNSRVEMPEMLLFNINPFSKHSKTFFNAIHEKRYDQVINAIEDAKNIFPEANFSFKEYTEFFNPREKYFMLNQHWKIWNYLHTKSRVAEIAKEQGNDVNQLYKEFCYNIKATKKDVIPYTLNEYINSKGIKTSSNEYNQKISELMHKEYFPQKINDVEVKTIYENNFDDLVNYAKNENAIMGFAHPGFTMQNFAKDKINDKLNYYIQKSNWHIKFIEKHHQAYPIGDAIGKEELEEYNKIIDRFKLIQIGGRDNHKKNLF